jgi:hypothetical protein
VRIFLSYGHDEHIGVALRLKADLEGRGHEVWFAVDRLQPGADWERYIEEGIEWAASGKFVLLLTPHSVRRPDGFCLNELEACGFRLLGPHAEGVGPGDRLRAAHVGRPLC